MKKIAEQLEKIKEKAQAKLEKREDSFENKSKNWQMSDKGQDNEAKTGELQTAIDLLDETIEAFQEFNED